MKDPAYNASVMSFYRLSMLTYESYIAGGSPAMTAEEAALLGRLFGAGSRYADVVVDRVREAYGSSFEGVVRPDHVKILAQGRVLRHATERFIFL